MAKKRKEQRPGIAREASPQTMKGGEDEPISPRGWRVIGAGALLVVLGFVVLSRVDPLGRNAAATVSPLLILGGYALVGLGLFVPAAPEGGEAVPPSPPAPRP